MTEVYIGQNRDHLILRGFGCKIEILDFEPVMTKQGMRSVHSRMAFRVGEYVYIGDTMIPARLVCGSFDFLVGGFSIMVPFVFAAFLVRRWMKKIKRRQMTFSPWVG